MKLLAIATFLFLIITTNTIDAFTRNMPSYQQVAEQIWHHDHPLPQQQASMKDLVRYATLAASSHNTQCWKFLISNDNNNDDRITIMPDLTRACPTVDPDNHHLFVSLGCAVENMVVAGMAHGLEAKVDSRNPEKGITVQFTRCPPKWTPQYEAIPQRRVSRAEYNGEKLSQQELDQLKKATDDAAISSSSGVKLIFLTDHSSLQTVKEHIMRANTIQMNDPNFRKELKAWIRFSERECLDHGDGLMGPPSGHPFAPRWIGSKYFDWTTRAHPENVKIEKQIDSSAGIAIFWSEKDDVAHWVDAGRLYQRFALTATCLGIRNAFLNQPVEVPETRAEFARAFGLQDGRADLIVRFGKGGVELPHSLRRPLEDVIVQQ